MWLFPGLPACQAASCRQKLYRETGAVFFTGEGTVLKRSGRIREQNFLDGKEGVTGDRRPCGEHLACSEDAVTQVRTKQQGYKERALKPRLPLFSNALIAQVESLNFSLSISSL